MTHAFRSLSVTVLAALLTAHLASASAADALRSQASFCSDVQALIVATNVEASNVLHSKHRAFVLSKPSVKPLVTHQHEPEEGEPGASEGMISCKMKTADHLRAIYGPKAAGTDLGCDGVMRVIVDASLKRQDNGASKAATRIEILPEQYVDNGDAWLAPLKVLEQASDGVLHIRTRGLRNDWLDARYAKQREEIRGVRYCHLVAPWFLDRVLSGESMPNAASERPAD
jgi:hypothetical protein